MFKKNDKIIIPIKIGFRECCTHSFTHLGYLAVLFLSLLGSQSNDTCEAHAKISFTEF